MPSQGNSLVIDDHFFIFVAVYIQYILFIFRPCATLVYLVLSQVFVELHTVLSLPMSHTDIAVICDKWIKSLHIFFKVSLFFCLPKSKSHVNHFGEFPFCFSWLFIVLSHSVKRIYGIEELIHQICSSICADFCAGCYFSSQ